MISTVILLLLIGAIVFTILGGLMVGSFYYGWRKGFMFCDSLYQPSTKVSRETWKEETQV